MPVGGPAFKITIDAKGLDDLMRKLRHLDYVAGQQVMMRTARYAMKPVVKDAKGYVEPHHRTGDLEASIRYAGKKSDVGTVIASGGVTVSKRKIAGETFDVEFGEGSGEFGTVKFKKTVDASWRWHFQELGTSHSKPYPYLRPAFYKNRDEMIRRIQKYLSDTVERVRQGGKP